MCFSINENFSYEKIRVFQPIISLGTLTWLSVWGLSKVWQKPYLLVHSGLVIGPGPRPDNEYGEVSLAGHLIEPIY